MRIRLMPLIFVFGLIFAVAIATFTLATSPTPTQRATTLVWIGFSVACFMGFVWSLPFKKKARAQ